MEHAITGQHNPPPLSVSQPPLDPAHTHRHAAIRVFSAHAQSGRGRRDPSQVLVERRAGVQRAAMLVELGDAGHVVRVEAAGDGAGVVQLQDAAVLGGAGPEALHDAHRERLGAQDGQIDTSGAGGDGGTKSLPRCIIQDLSQRYAIYIVRSISFETFSPETLILLKSN